MIKNPYSYISKKDIWHIKTSDDTGKSLHIFLKINLLKKPQLEKLFKESPELIADFSEYGEIIATCHGRYPTLSVRQLLKEKYDIDV